MAVETITLLDEGTRELLHGSGGSPGPQYWYTPAHRVIVKAPAQHDSYNNRWRSRPHGRLNVGSPWSNIKPIFEGVDIQLDVQFRDPYVHGRYEGYQGPIGFIGGETNLDSSDFLALGAAHSETDETDLYGLGTTAIARCIPTNPISDLPTGVGELLTEGLPSLIGSGILRNRKFTPREVSGEWLNYWFGLKPFWSDLQKFADAATKAEALVNAYAANSGKVLRRGYEFPARTDHIPYDMGDNNGWHLHLGGFSQSQAQYFATPAFGGWGGTRTGEITVQQKQWFSGAFTYYLPGSNDWSSKLNRELSEMRYLYGGISADTAWNLLPFSWAADWFTNAGDVIHNLSAFANDGLVMPWGYIMEQFTVIDRRQLEGVYVNQSLVTDSTFSIPNVLTTSIGYESKRRRMATPFGFGLDPGTLSTRQWSILGALGIQAL